MRKSALLIGASEYEAGLDSLPSAIRDVEALERVLQSSEIGGFHTVEVLKNPQRQEMASAIYQFFNTSNKNDLLLLFYSGHGVLDEHSDFYLSSQSTSKESIPPTSISARDIQIWMSRGRSRRQVIILDCCFAGAFPKGLTTKNTGTIDIRSQLGGEGRVILTAATSTQYAFEQKGLDLSIYSHYLVEGLERGAADLDNDGRISIEELHEYVSKKVKEAAPAMTPEIYNFMRDTEPIQIARSAIDDPKLKYRREVEKRVYQGQFSIPARRLLTQIQLGLKLDPSVAESIEAEVLQPWRERERKLRVYRETLEDAIKAEKDLSEQTWKDLQDYQRFLGLRDEDVSLIHDELIIDLGIEENASANEAEASPRPTNELVWNLDEDDFTDLYVGEEDKDEVTDFYLDEEKNTWLIEELLAQQSEDVQNDKTN